MCILQVKSKLQLVISHFTQPPDGFFLSKWAVVLGCNKLKWARLYAEVRGSGGYVECCLKHPHEKQYLITYSKLSFTAVAMEGWQADALPSAVCVHEHSIFSSTQSENRMNPLGEHLKPEQKTLNCQMITSTSWYEWKYILLVLEILKETLFL